MKWNIYAPAVVMAECLRRWTRNPLGSPRAGLNPADYGKSTFRDSLVAQRLKPLPAMQETWVRYLGWEDPLEKEMATHSRTLAWRIPWREKPGRLQYMGSQRVRHDWATSHTLRNQYCFHLKWTLSFNIFLSFYPWLDFLKKSFKICWGNRHFKIIMGT